ncbi:MAG: hypothetical protein KJ556_21455 [Gammaproteobacteria bacterium]|nr:hypothetical protein [Gammaproteobacteria bacterium]
MLIGKNHKIESDSMNVILSKKVKRVKKDTGEKHDAWQCIGYYATVANALHGLVNQNIKDTELTDIKAIAAEINNLHKMIEALPKSL